MILAGDVGGTKIQLALAPASDPLRHEREAMLATAEIHDPVRAVADFAATSPRPLRAAVLGVAGPVFGNAVRGTNLPWEIDGAEVSRALGDVPVSVVNDLEASAHGLDTLAPDELVTLQPGLQREGPSVFVSPGTGLGESVLVRNDDGWFAVAGEGGHADFAPRSEEEVALFTHLRERWGRVSWERVVSGPGLVNVFCWLRDTGRVEDDAGIEAAPGDGMAAPLIGAAAGSGKSRLCAEAVHVWSLCLAAEAGNQALRFVARGGVYLAGGIPAKLLHALQTEAFLHAFRDKDPHEDLLAEIPLHVVLAPDLPLRGAARLAAELATG